MGEEGDRVGGRDLTCLDFSREADLLLYCGPPLGIDAGLLEESPSGEGVAHALLDHLRQRPEQAGSVALTLPLDRHFEPSPAIADGLIRVVFWRVLTLPDGDCLGILRQCARQGVWNVLLSGPKSPASVQKAWDTEAAADPVVLHARMHQDPGGMLQAVPIHRRYGETRDLDGFPLWTRLADPTELLRAVVRYGTKRLCRMRVAGDGSTYELGSALGYHFESPPQMPLEVFEEVLSLVAAGGAVTTERVRRNLQKAYLIGYVTERGRVVADSSMKHPREAYVETVRQRTGIDLSGFLERGYTSVRPEYRGLGIGTKLLEGLTAGAKGQKFYSIIAEDNEATKTMARRNNTVQIASFFSEKMGKQVGIWTAAEFADSVGR